MQVLQPSCQLTQPAGIVGRAGSGADAGAATPISKPPSSTCSVGAWHVNSQHESVRMAHWPIGQLGGWHIMRHICGRESSQNEVCAVSVTTAGVGLLETVDGGAPAAAE